MKNIFSFSNKNIKSFSSQFINSKNIFKSFSTTSTTTSTTTSLNPLHSNNAFNCDKKLTDFFKQYFDSNLSFHVKADKFKCFRVMGSKGEILDSKYENISKEICLKIFKTMVQIKECDTRFNMAQREGKISFYMTCNGEEASTVSSVAALSDEDMIYPQYRESACLLYRGFTIQEMANQLAGNELDCGKGRQMPVHYGSRKLNYQTVSSPLCTQVPQASGAGYHYRVSNQNKIAVTYFGDGAASEGDFHPALNFASVLKSQTLFFCRNNMYAISTPIDDQYNGDGIAIRGLAYGIHTIRVDGNDVFAVYNAVKAAREHIVTTGTPALIESMTYRMGDHSTSDFSKMYRDNEEMKKWKDYLEIIGDPISRFYLYLMNKNWITENEYKDIVDDSKEQVRTSLKESLKSLKPSIDSLFEDVYENIPLNLQKQRENLREHLNKYPDTYNLEQYQKNKKSD
jgi:2-oxoisovalerate dehydrogenase E1 component alpha subunit